MWTDEPARSPGPAVYRDRGKEERQKDSTDRESGMRTRQMKQKGKMRRLIFRYK